MDDPYRTPDPPKPTPSKIVNIVLNGEWLIVLDDNGHIWTAPIGGNNSSGGYLPNRAYHPILGNWMELAK